MDEKSLLRATYGRASVVLLRRLGSTYKNGTLYPLDPKANFLQFGFPELPLTHYEVTFHEGKIRIDFDLEASLLNINNEWLAKAQPYFSEYSLQTNMDVKVSVHGTKWRRFGASFFYDSVKEMIRTYDEKGQISDPDRIFCETAFSTEPLPITEEDKIAAYVVEKTAQFIIATYPRLYQIIGKETGEVHLLNHIIVDDDIRKAIFQTFAKVINSAHILSNRSWALYFKRGGLVLMVRHVDFLMINMDFYGKKKEGFYGLVSVVPEDKKLILESAGCVLEPGFSSVQGSQFLFAPYSSKNTFINILPLIQELLQNTLKEFVKSGSKVYNPHGYDPDLTTGLNYILNEKIPHPDYYLTSDPGFISKTVDLASIKKAISLEGYHFTESQIAQFFTALQTKGFVILSGISGTGKTKLVQKFANLFPKSLIRPYTAEGEIEITVQPYMPKYNRIIIPKDDAERLFELPELKKKVELKISFEGQEENCQFVHASYPGTTYLSLMLRGKARIWFKENFQAQDKLFIEPQIDPDKDNTLMGFRLINPKTASRQTPPSSEIESNFEFISVRPDWRDNRGLLGYYNLLTRKYVSTPFLDFVLKAVESYKNKDGLVWFVLLDEMNLARVEYYFSDLLSVMESGRELSGDREGFTSAGLAIVYPNDAEGKLPPPKVYLPPNLYIIGTVNVDETTHSFSPKVLDRAFTIELTEADFRNYSPQINPLSSNGSKYDLNWQTKFNNLFTHDGAFAQIDKNKIGKFINEIPTFGEELQNLNESLQPYDLHFAYRVFDEIVSFLVSAKENGFFGEPNGLDSAFDAAVLMKVLPKFHGSRSKLEAPLQKVLIWCLKDGNEQLRQKILQGGNSLREMAEQFNELRTSFRYPLTAKRVIRLLQALYTTGFAAFG